MALTKCTECSGQVSTKASACPHCGAPAPVARANKAGRVEGKWKHGVLVGIIAVSFALLILFVIELRHPDETSRSAGTPIPESDSIEALEEEGAQPAEDVSLMGVRVGETFLAATETLRPQAIRYEEFDSGNPPLQYATEYEMSEGLFSIYSDAYPEGVKEATPIVEIVLRADVVDYDVRTVRKLYDDYKKEFSMLYGPNRPKEHDLGEIQVYEWQWKLGSTVAQIEYQQQNDMPYSTEVIIQRRPMAVPGP